MSLLADCQMLDIYFRGRGEWDNARKSLNLAAPCPEVGGGATVHIWSLSLTAGPASACGARYLCSATSSCSHTFSLSLSLSLSPAGSASAYGVRSDRLRFRRRRQLLPERPATPAGPGRRWVHTCRHSCGPAETMGIR